MTVISKISPQIPGIHPVKIRIPVSWISFQEQTEVLNYICLLDSYSNLLNKRQVSVFYRFMIISSDVIEDKRPNKLDRPLRNPCSCLKLRKLQQKINHENSIQ